MIVVVCEVNDMFFSVIFILKSTYYSFSPMVKIARNNENDTRF